MNIISVIFVAWW